MEGRITRSKTVVKIQPKLTLKSVIELCEQHKRQKGTRVLKKQKVIMNENILDKLTNILHPLKELESIIGLDKVKECILEHVIYLAQELNSETDMSHIQIVGEPGGGKTTLAAILGHIYAGLGFLEHGNVVYVTRADLIGEHLGSTSIKTEEMLNTCRGNVMFIDEVYSFGCRDRKDSFSKECLDCINQFLSTYRQDILCIIAGYEDDIEECIFSVNKGLKRRFLFKYIIPTYTMEELKQIFISQIHLNKWKINKNEIFLKNILHDQNKHLFKSSGGDTEILFVRCKMAHSSRLFLDYSNKIKKKTLNALDLQRGFEMFSTLKAIKTNTQHSMMYI